MPKQSATTSQRNAASSTSPPRRGLVASFRPVRPPLDSRKQNRGGSTSPVVPPQKHPMKLTRCTNPSGTNSDTAMHARQNGTLTNTRLRIDDSRRCLPPSSSAAASSAVAVQIFPSTSSPNGMTMRGAVTESTKVMRIRTRYDDACPGGIARRASPSNTYDGEKSTRNPLDMKT